MVLESLMDFTLGERLELFFHLFHGKKIGQLIDALDNRAVSVFQKFVWEKTVEFGIICRGKNFNRKEITRKMMPTPNFQRQQNCTQRAYYCKGTYCIQTNPACARKKIKEHVDVMAEAIQEYIRIVKQLESV